jgi:hypothetical protein
LVERGYYEHKQRLVKVIPDFLAHPLTYHLVPAPPPPPPLVTQAPSPPPSTSHKIPTQTRTLPIPTMILDEIQQPHQLKPAVNRQLKPKLPSFSDIHQAELFGAVRRRAQVFPSE